MNLLWLAGAAALLFAGMPAEAASLSSETEDDTSTDSGEDNSTAPADTTGYEQRFIDLFNQYGPQYGMSPLWLQAFCMNESSMGEDPLVKAGQLSQDGLSKGIMQLTLTTARRFENVTLDDLNDPETSVRIACKLIQINQAAFSTADARYVEWVVKSYNRGVARTNQERTGDPKGLAEPGFTRGNTYWSRWQRNYAKIGGT